MSFDARGLSSACGRPVRFFERCGSTNRLAAALGAEGAASGALVVADAQLAGRGRLGRSWASPPGLNLYFSLLVRPSLPAARAALICLAAAAGAADVLPEVEIKWPNDLLVDGAKIGGILAEASLAGDRLERAVVGVGINVNQLDFPGLERAGSLARVRGAALDRAALLGDLVPAIEARIDQLVSAPERVIERCRLRSATLGQRVRVAGLEGLAVSLRSDGALMLETESGLRPILTGDVEMLGVLGSPVKESGWTPCEQRTHTS